MQSFTTYMELTQNLLLTLIAALISIVLASFLAARLQRLLSEPITELAKTISLMTEKEQYDQQVHKLITTKLVSSTTVSMNC